MARIAIKKRNLMSLRNKIEVQEKKEFEKIQKKNFSMKDLPISTHI